jgi:hypothetical protein
MGDVVEDGRALIEGTGGESSRTSRDRITRIPSAVRAILRRLAVFDPGPPGTGMHPGYLD